ncbi:MAG TPA: hypothetical protein VN738_04750 [Acidothermaceae bacterium]|nr:hypothetical protein [Acidothermaceae bacterium]
MISGKCLGFRLLTAAGGVLALVAAASVASIGMVGTGSVALAATSSTTASASASSSDCSPSDVVVVSRNSDLTTVSVQLATAASGKACDVSLHAYATEGPTWPTSGTQRLVDFATVHLSDAPQTLSVTGSSCFGQNDLVMGTTRNDGVDGPLPHYPNHAFGSLLVTWWVGGSACTTPTPTATVSPTSTVSPTMVASPPSSPPATVLPLQFVAPTPVVLPSPSPTVLGEQFQNAPPSAVGPTALPFTGQPVVIEALSALALVVLGSLLYLVSRRRAAADTVTRD